MANNEHLERLKQGVNAWNLWREVHPTLVPDLKEADLGDADLHGMNLCNAHFERAYLFGADLRHADLRGANFSQAYLSTANLREVDLRGAYLQRARFRETILCMADLRGANLQDAQIGRTTFGDVDLSTIRGLDTILHRGPSTIGIDTLYRSRANIPEAFLRGAGVPDEFITYVKSLVGQPFVYHSGFISYSSRDKALAQRLYTALRHCSCDNT